MIQVQLPIFDPIQEDFLRYRFNCWDGPVKISLGHPIGEGIFCAIHPTYDNKKHSSDVQTITLEVPHHKMFQFERWPHHYIGLQDALRIKMDIMSAYYSEINRVINVTRRRTHKLKPAIDYFLDMLELLSGDYELNINYEQIRKMITRDDRRLQDLLSEYNQKTVYQTHI